ncbi:TatD family hydrolase [Rhodocytophaga aerolata]|uniref:TatD family hydrolase n=1 Tax=Rhodocytophaga aerolata TaxID=455078 RepID=A0ABT8QZG9_9BACT|nr:TatD family hydrolase [Rhodocytophaga aerolata]MDO1445233.1 TatD family hydrolase [Rhodocytophaga aerolata]
MNLIDTHAHIYAPEFDSDRPRMLERAFEQGVQQIYMPNIDHTSIESMLRLEEQYPTQCFAMMGLHPCYVTATFEQELGLVEEWLNKRKFIAVGEIGLDYYWSTEFKVQQEEAFVFQVDLAKKHKLPVVIHCRNSFQETVDLLKQTGVDGLTGIFHCFTGTLTDAQQVVDMGFLLGIGGVSTFKNGGLDQVLPFMELKNIVLETDSPYLAPVPYRGKRNEVSYTALVAQRVADLAQVSIEEVAAVTTENAKQLMNTYSARMQ